MADSECLPVPCWFCAQDGAHHMTVKTCVECGEAICSDHEALAKCPTCDSFKTESSQHG